jgi:hypothetical protein
MNPHSIPTAVLAMLLVACASGAGTGPADAARPQVLTLPLHPSPAVANGTGQVTLAESKDATYVSVTVSRVPQGMTRPVHLYTYLYGGSCERLSPQPERALTKRVLASTPGIRPVIRGPYSVGNRIDTPLGELRSAPRAILVRSGPADGGMDLYCGNIG